MPIAAAGRSYREGRDFGILTLPCPDSDIVRVRSSVAVAGKDGSGYSGDGYTGL